MADDLLPQTQRRSIHEQKWWTPKSSRNSNLIQFQTPDYINLMNWLLRANPKQCFTTITEIQQFRNTGGKYRSSRSKKAAPKWSIVLWIQRQRQRWKAGISATTAAQNRIKRGFQESPSAESCWSSQRLGMTLRNWNTNAGNKAGQQLLNLLLHFHTFS